LLISSIGIMPDVADAVTMDLKEAGDLLYLVGEFQPVFGGSHFNLVTVDGSTVNDLPSTVSEPVPSVSQVTPAVYCALHRAIKQGLVRACHDLSEGGLAVAAAEMCIGGRLGLELELTADDPVRTLFGETNGCLLVEVKPELVIEFEKLLNGLPRQKIGEAVAEPRLSIVTNNKSKISISVSDLVSAWNTPLQPN
jgi:phosphoribosylformylglycinamidine synthase